jgi:hypothetical protein
MGETRVSEKKEDFMRVSRPMLRTIARTGICLILASAAIVALAAMTSAAQKSPGCPPIIASLLPKNGSIRGGDYNAAGPMGMGSGSADLPFEHPCIKSEKFPARVSIAITYYGSEMAEILKMQGDAANEQTLQSAMDDFKRSKRSPKREKLAGGEIVYTDFTTECPAEGAAGTGTVNRPPIPNVKLKGVARTASVRLEVTLEGKISVDLAKAAVAEVFENLKKANFDNAK